MKCKILHESPGRIRVHVVLSQAMSIKQADWIEAELERCAFTHTVRVYERTSDIVICYHGERSAVLTALSSLSQDAWKQNEVEEHSTRELNRVYQNKLMRQVIFQLIRQFLFPSSIKLAFTLLHSVKYLTRGIMCLRRRKLEVEVLDALSIGVSILRGDVQTASSVMFLLGLGELLEEWTHRKSVENLVRSMSLNVDMVWRIGEKSDTLTPIEEIRAGDYIRIRAGGLIPLDGQIISGEAMINQASLTGESLPASKQVGATVYAGTVVEEGECVVEVKAESGGSRYDRLVSMIEESQKLASNTETRTARLANKLVPYSFLGTLLTYLFTRNVTRAISFLMVDFSCALKLSMPLAFLSAIGEAGRARVTVKGGKFLEAAANVDTIVFDKTGTLTRACPTVAEVIPFNGNDANEMLRLAACLEEHFPHSMANAVVRRAQELNLDHEEMHAKVEYVVAHGIVSIVNNQKVLIGSYHFVFEDEGCKIPESEKERFEALNPSYSHLYLAIAGYLSAVICISDPLREETKTVLQQLRALGVSRLVMMTGDSERTAAAIAQEAGLDYYRAEVLPEDKAAFIEEEHAVGRTVLMIGDGINDAPALAAADAGIAVSDGAAIAREVADITISTDNLHTLVFVRQLSVSLMRRVNWNYHFVMTFNSALMLLGALGLLPPATSALLHNLSTLFVSLKSMLPLSFPPDSKNVNIKDIL